MHISNNRKLYQSQYTFKRDNLGFVHHHPHLAVQLSDDLRWNIHIPHLSAKSNHALGFYQDKSVYMLTEKTKQSVYFTLGLPSIEYASAAWDPVTNKYERT